MPAPSHATLRLARAAGLAAGLAAIAGCGPGRTYQRPAVQVPDAFADAAAAPVRVRWWQAFADPELDRLIERAVGANPDLRGAVARVREARALLGRAAAPLGPVVAAEAGAARGQDAPEAIREGRHRGPENTYRGGVALSWEIDLFGGALRGIEAADGDIQVAEAERDGVLVVLAAETARAWLDCRHLAARIGQAQRIAAQAALVARLAGERAAASRAPADAAAAADAVVTEAAAGDAADRLAVELARARHRLAVLCGDASGTALAGDGAPPAWPGILPAGIPAELLRRRPDLRAAERRIAAAVARVGVAEADLYPRFALGGMLAAQSASLGGLGTPDSLLWSLGPSLRWPIFASGAIAARTAMAEARVDQAVAAYESAIAIALAEVADAVAGIGGERRERDRWTAAAAAIAGAAPAAEAAGLDDRLAAARAAAAALHARGMAMAAEHRLALALVQLARALGGGYEDPALQRRAAEPGRGGIAADRRP